MRVCEISGLDFTKYYSGDEIENNGMGGVCSTGGGKERYIQDFGRQT
jgi:hypothetical protein